ncbi:hypothetical protein NUW58_g8841 [Xylaria curta]|uniref:Uncharacterized protein n=1 Tax=Xylaria curta TaxID=42375 RepID=A0ACC1N3H2_9PEZI|nr:hypothetical protein NUW58_g8841 [Xylaria curta]
MATKVPGWVSEIAVTASRPTPLTVSNLTTGISSRIKMATISVIEGRVVNVVSRTLTLCAIFMSGWALAHPTGDDPMVE